ncbi:hypothetical protein [Streptomyces hirsutus]|uniref:hypothetical protein n=1 Tax=Streptomyces hirsutus TaxID=35620 RepID=UPI000AC815A0|nr:hypothetical protein [Streptomyces hirsutus]
MRAVIGTVTTPALRSHLYEQLDGWLHEAAMRAVEVSVTGAGLVAAGIAGLVLTRKADG